MKPQRNATRPPKQTTLSFRCPLPLAKRMAIEAANDGRTVSNWIRLQVERHLKAAG